MSRRTAIALLGALGCLGLALVTWLLAFHTGVGQAADEALLRDLYRLQDTRAATLAHRLSWLCNPIPYALLAAIVGTVALLVRGLRGALVVGAILAVSNAVSQLLKRALAVDRVPGAHTPAVHVDPVSWPSGHSTAAMALALCAVIAAPAAWRLLTGLGGALFASGVATSVVLLGWHFPSDAVGGFAVAGATASLGVSLLAPTAAPQRRWQRVRG